jgi:hypothetical protein
MTRGGVRGLLPRNRSTGALYVLCGLAWTGLIYAVLGRLFVHVQLEWMTGSIWDHVDRVRSGKPLYVSPSWDWTPFLYTPGYYYAAALLAQLVPVFLACRLVSLMASLATAWMLWAELRDANVPPRLRIVALGLYAAAFSYVGYWYDVERCDTLFVALTFGALRLLSARTLRGHVFAGMLLGVAFAVKQQASAFAMVVPLTMGLLGPRARNSVVMFAVSAVIVGGVVLGLHQASGGWSTYYILRMPRSHGFETSLIKGLLLTDLPLAFLPVLGGAAAVSIVVVAAVRRARSQLPLRTRHDARIAFVAAGCAAAIASRLHIGGWDNVLLPLSTYGVLAATVLVSRVERTWPAGKGVLTTAIALQFVLWAYDPTACIPARNSRSAYTSARQQFARWADDGDVLYVGRGAMTSNTHAHQAAVIDVYNMEHGVPDGLLAPFAARQFSRVVVDAKEDLSVPFVRGIAGQLLTTVMRYYFVAAWLDSSALVAVTGWRASPRYVLRPRNEPLPPLTAEQASERFELEALVARQRSARNEPTSEQTQRDTWSVVSPE